MNQNEYDVNNVKLLINGIEIQDFDDSEQFILAEFKKNPFSKLECIKNIEPKPHAIGISVKQEGEDYLARNGIAIIDDSSLSEEELVIIKSIRSRLDGRYLGNVKQEGDE